MSNSGISVGLNRGYVIHKLLPAKKDPRRVSASLDGLQFCLTSLNFLFFQPTSKKAKFTKEVVREVAGFAPYERRLIDLCRNNLDKRALRLAKRKLGSHQRAKKKREEMAGVAFRLRQEAARRLAEEKAAAKAAAK